MSTQTTAPCIPCKTCRHAIKAAAGYMVSCGRYTSKKKFEKPVLAVIDGVCRQYRPGKPRKPR